MKRAVIYFLLASGYVAISALAYAQYFDPDMGSGNAYSLSSGDAGADTGGGRIAWTIQATKNGSGSGTIVGGGILCGQRCAVVAENRTSVSVTATADADSVFAGWSGGCSGKNPVCSFVIDKNTQIIALFNKSPIDENFSNNKNYGSDESYQPAVAFQEEVKKIAVTKKKVWLGISPLGIGRSILQKLFNPSMILGPRWKINTDAAGNQSAQGSLVGPGSLIRILVNLMTGSIYFKFDGSTSNYTASYFNQDGAQRTELVNAKGDMYQGEQVFDADGGERQSALIAHGKTLFGAFTDGVVFLTPSGAFPSASPASWIGLSIPQSVDSNAALIPVEKIIKMLSELSQKAVSFTQSIFFAVSHAAQSAWSGAQLSAKLSEYRKSETAIHNQISDLQNSFAQADFNNSYLNFDALQNQFADYEAANARFITLGKQLSVMRALARPGDWLMNQDAVVADLIQQGIDPETAALIAQAVPPFDFYAIGNADTQKNVVLKGICIAESDNERNEVTHCSVQKVSAAQAGVIITYANGYRAAADEARAFAGKIENALFSGGLAER